MMASLVAFDAIAEKGGQVTISDLADHASTNLVKLRHYLTSTVIDDDKQRLNVLDANGRFNGG